MKKKNIITIIILIIIIAIIAGIFIYKGIMEKEKEYNIAEVNKYNYFSLKENEKFGVIDNQGNIIIEPQYDDVKIPNPEKNVFICYEGQTTKVMNDKKEQIYTEYNNITPLVLKNVSTDLRYEKSVLKYEEDGKYGLISLEGKKITNPIYEEIDTLQYKEGEFVIKKDNKYGIMNMNGYVIINPEYDNIKADAYYSTDTGYKNDGYIVSNTTDEGYRYGYIDNEGNKILDTNYNDLYRINYEGETYLVCAENGKYGLFNKNKNIIPNEYQAITYIEGDNLCLVQKGKKYGIITLEGSMILQVRYNQIDINGDYIYTTDENSEIKVYDKKGNEVEVNQNTTISTIQENPEYKIYIDTSNGTTLYSIYQGENKITNGNYNYIGYLSNNNYIASRQNEKLGVIDQNENIKLEMKYDTIRKIDGTNLVEADIQSTNTIEIYSSNLEKIAEMNNATLTVEDNYIKLSSTTEIKYFDLEGKEKQNTEIFPENTIFAKSQNGKWGFVDKNGQVVVDYQYDEVTEQNEYGFAGVKLNDKWGIVDKNGKIIVEPTYEINAEETPEFIGTYYRVTYGFGEFYYTKGI
mgnify:CR=1 FL=1